MAVFPLGVQKDEIGVAFVDAHACALLYSEKIFVEAPRHVIKPDCI
jgi:hypothetical protein